MGMTDPAIETLDDLLKARGVYMQLLREKGKGLVTGLLQKFLGMNPLILGIRWRQYTPYFNDGEPCEFSVRDILFRLTEGGPEEGDYEDGYIYTSDILDVPTRTAAKELETQLWNAQDALEVAFGDHALVTATREGIEVQEYSHD